MRTRMLVLKVNPHSLRATPTYEGANKVFISSDIVITLVSAPVSACKVLGSRNVPFKLTSFSWNPLGKPSWTHYQVQPAARLHPWTPVLPQVPTKPSWHGLLLPPLGPTERQGHQGPWGAWATWWVW